MQTGTRARRPAGQTYISFKPRSGPRILIEVDPAEPPTKGDILTALRYATNEVLKLETDATPRPEPAPPPVKLWTPLPR